MNDLLANPIILVLKAICACALALTLDHLIGNPDHVSSTFIAVLCVSPTVWLGLREAWAQLVGSLLGGIWGTLGVWTGWPVFWILPPAVGLSIGTTYLVRVPGGYRVAAFSALFILLVPWGTPWYTLMVRVLSLATGALSAFLINVLFSSLNYRRIFQSRLELVEQQVLELIPKVLQGSPAEAQVGFNWLQALRNELQVALEEMRWRHNSDAIQELECIWHRLSHIKYLLHLTFELSALRHEKGYDFKTIEPLIEWFKAPSAHLPPLPRDLQPLARRLWHTWEHLYPKK